MSRVTSSVTASSSARQRKVDGYEKDSTVRRRADGGAGVDDLCSFPKPSLILHAPRNLRRAGRESVARLRLYFV
jgi:hypothetical protein